MKFESCLGMTFSADAAGVQVLSGRGRRRVAGSIIIMVWLGSQGDGGARGGMDCAVSKLRARNGRGRIPQSGGGQTGLYVLLEVAAGLSVSCLNRCIAM